MRFQPELFERSPDKQMPTPVDQYFALSYIVEKNFTTLPSKNWLIAAWLTVILGLWPISPILFWNYYSRNASYRKAIYPVIYEERN